MHRICVIGGGHVGLVAAACFAQMGHSVICVDNDSAKIALLKKGKMPFYEPKLATLVKKTANSKRLVFSDSLDNSIKKSKVIFIAVGTPPKSDGSADLSAIEDVARVIAKNLNSYKLIVEKSTVPVQTGKKIKETIARYKKGDATYDVASNPEFLREGKAVHDSFYPDRIVLGVDSKQAETILRQIYSKLKTKIIVTDVNTAEIIKHASNSFLASKISFINAVSRVCDKAGADVEKVSQAMGLDKRIGGDFLSAGIGWGGFCFPKDVEAFAYISKKLGYDFSFLKEVTKINHEQQLYFTEKIRERLWVIRGKKIAILGLSFKPNTDDMRFAPSINIVKTLEKEGAELTLYDPKAMNEAKNIFKSKKIMFAKDAYAAVKGCDCVCFLTEWKQFLALDFKKIKKTMNNALIADGRNMLDPVKLIAAGFEYIGLGRGK
ncbi:MAG: UDP-glucose/GDP-mannose dehydrogenase family protein [Candidatus Omnitrophica bacterium]|nr:UDP-glucose/GDP-mannose dehydrogenase family protein [Candidatus Omnitrophota bacterium]